MERYKLEIKKSAAKEIKVLPKNVIKRILPKIESLALNPRPAGSVKLSNQERYRIGCADYRILYEVHDQRILIIIVRVAHRREAYKK